MLVRVYVTTKQYQKKSLGVNIGINKAIENNLNLSKSILSPKK